ncbi:MAG: AMP-binding protein [Hyphomicrobiales bacterium]|nr:AMP-binding protein [Hyphomicrobiales bacterium]MCP5373417.1 AMP-binding protein [Hyphomicrobiales bacterium]
MSGLLRSYVSGPGPTPLRGETVGGVFDRAVGHWPHHQALVVRHQGIRWTYLELAAQVESLAAGLLSLGLRRGERIGLLAPNCAEWVVAQFATAKAGLILVNINPAYRLPELRQALRSVGCRALITADRFKDSDYLAMLRRLSPGINRLAFPNRELPDLERVIVLAAEAPAGTLSYGQVRHGATARDRARVGDLAEALQFDDPVNIQFTSGTTGTPKAAVLSHHAIVNNARLVAANMDLTPSDRLCVPVPMYHCFGMVLGTLACVTVGACAVLPSAGFDPRATLDALEAEQCTALHGVPTMFIAALDDPEFARFDLHHLRTGIMAGAPCPEELMRRVMGDMHLPQITIAYGMTETGPVSFQTRVDDSVARRVSTVGRVLPHTEVKIVDAEGCVVPTGTAGELLTRGYCVMRGYWEHPERTAAAIDDAGWMHSGDLAVMDEAGYCRIVGRLKDMIIRGGENIYPREIEDVLYTHPKVDAAEVFGVRDEKYGEEVCAWIKLRRGAGATAEEIRTYCGDRLAHFKVPRHIRFVVDFPMTVTGKVQKFRMRQAMEEALADGGPRARPVPRGDAA